MDAFIRDKEVVQLTTIILTYVKPASDDDDDDDDDFALIRRMEYEL